MNFEKNTGWYQLIVNVGERKKDGDTHVKGRRKNKARMNEGYNRRLGNNTSALNTILCLVKKIMHYNLVALGDRIMYGTSSLEKIQKKLHSYILFTYGTYSLIMRNHGR